MKYFIIMILFSNTLLGNNHPEDTLYIDESNQFMMNRIRNNIIIKHSQKSHSCDEQWYSIYYYFNRFRLDSIVYEGDISFFLKGYFQNMIDMGYYDFNPLSISDGKVLLTRRKIFVYDQSRRLSYIHFYGGFGDRNAVEIVNKNCKYYTSINYIPDRTSIFMGPEFHLCNQISQEITYRGDGLIEHVEQHIVSATENINGRPRVIKHGSLLLNGKNGVKFIETYYMDQLNGMCFAFSERARLKYSFIAIDGSRIQKLSKRDLKKFRK
jgi:hypothetical protein